MPSYPRMDAQRPGVRTGHTMAEVWLTYAELAERLGISQEAARQKAIRGRWRRQQGNDGKARVLLDVDTEAATHRPRKRPDERTDDPRTVAAVEAHLATLREALARVEAAAAKAENLAEQRLAEVHRERERVAELTTEMLRVTSTLLSTTTERDEARHRAEALQRELEAIRARPWWKRIFA